MILPVKSQNFMVKIYTFFRKLFEIERQALQTSCFLDVCVQYIRMYVFNISGYMCSIYPVVQYIHEEFHLKIPFALCLGKNLLGTPIANMWRFTINIFVFLAVQNSSIGDLVTHSLTDRSLLLLTLQSDPRDL